ncbi:Metallo-hydrolase/oxidoreductase [Basidiobolus meristosporus CBS 931.73]|uniref:Metallo-hydrolase/oxidoreductase n=1 Tax=Basidiobolus meristosporus CBS 931.73 TaxID=1314790 RepID=A0A1Y1YQX3_9FUNG|nr:Metallo-hydrolase/oxidoreductase [Basidiobolus meristosporus CBS 931.73]|eukprot:ORY00438.1 Metallo-hydrolase/oxidoreductase [Basidiobolus meristosporus CBS 931.73]
MRFHSIHLQALTLVALVLTTFSFVAESTLRILHSSSPEASFASVSTAVIGKQEVFIIDSGFTVSAAQQLITLIRQSTSLPVTKIFATHEHPDHYFGATEVLRAYPNASLLASPSVVQNMRQSVQEKVGQWTPVFGQAEIPSSPKTAEPFRGNRISLRGNEDEPIHLLQPLQGDVEDVTAYWIPSQKTLITGDLVYSSKIHVWLAEAQRPRNRANWIRSLNYLNSLGPTLVIGGHVPSTETPRVSDIQATKEYIEYFDKNVYGKGYTTQQIFDLLKSRYPDRIGLAILNQTAIAFGKQGATE